MRRQFTKTLHELFKQDDRLVLLFGDVDWGFGPIADEFPNRVFNCGIAEQSMVSMSAGMALEGLRPVVTSLTPFVLERAFEAWKMDVGIMKAPVIGCGYAYYPTHGNSQTPLNPRALVEVLPNVNYFEPKDSAETAMMLRRAVESNQPAFISLTKDHTL